MSQTKEYIATDSDGAMWVGEARVSLEAIVVAHRAGESPEYIRDAYPALALDEVYGAIAFALANEQVVQQYMKRQEALWDALKAKVDADPPPVLLRLRALKAARAKTK
jgi:uncharacterized protein (DUF433 family)